MKRITFLGGGAWGTSLANMLARAGNSVTVWTRNKDLVAAIAKDREHPKFPGIRLAESLKYTNSIEEALDGTSMIVESVTTTGLRPVIQQFKKQLCIDKPFVLTSKGIEQKTGLLVHEIAEQELGGKKWVGCISGPSLADEVMRKIPTTVVCSANEQVVLDQIQKTFNTDFFRVYPNSDFMGVEFGGAMKNSIAIACGISDGLGFGGNTKAALMTRGLHEMRKLAASLGCKAETLNGLAGMGDLCVTCLSNLSRNYRFGYMLAEGVDPETAKKKIGMVVEGANTCVSGRELGNKHGVPLPITETVYEIIYEGLEPKKAVVALLSREVKKEHL